MLNKKLVLVAISLFLIIQHYRYSYAYIEDGIENHNNIESDKGFIPRKSTVDLNLEHYYEVIELPATTYDYSKLDAAISGAGREMSYIISSSVPCAELTLEEFFEDESRLMTDLRNVELWYYNTKTTYAFRLRKFEVKEWDSISKKILYNTYGYYYKDGQGIHDIEKGTVFEGNPFEWSIEKRSRKEAFKNAIESKDSLYSYNVINENYNEVVIESGYMKDIIFGLAPPFYKMNELKIEPKGDAPREKDIMTEQEKIDKYYKNNDSIQYTE